MWYPEDERTYLADTAHTHNTQYLTLRVMRQGVILQPVALARIHLGMGKLSQSTDEEVQSSCRSTVVDSLRGVRHLNTPLGRKVHIDRVVACAVPADVFEGFGQLRQKLLVVLADTGAVGGKDGDGIRVLGLDFGQEGLAGRDVGVDNGGFFAVLVELSTGSALLKGGSIKLTL